MKNRALFIALLICISCNLNSQNSLSNQEQLVIDTTKSKLKWIAEYTFFFGGHEGEVSFKEGYFLKSKDGSIAGGEFIIDMHSIICTDNGKVDKDSDLVKHLKDEDFFEVNTYPESKLIITAVKYSDDGSIWFDADLTIKGVTMPIGFDAKVDYQKQLLATRFKIDRQRWGIDYNSSMRDSAISDGVGFEVLLSL